MTSVAMVSFISGAVPANLYMVHRLIGMPSSERIHLVAFSDDTIIYLEHASQISNPKWYG